MDISSISFLTGLGCGVCIGLTYYVLQKHTIFSNNTEELNEVCGFFTAYNLLILN